MHFQRKQISAPCIQIQNRSLCLIFAPKKNLPKVAAVAEMSGDPSSLEMAAVSPKSPGETRVRVSLHPPRDTISPTGPTTCVTKGERSSPTLPSSSHHEYHGSSSSKYVTSLPRRSGDIFAQGSFQSASPLSSPLSSLLAPIIKHAKAVMEHATSPSSLPDDFFREPRLLIPPKAYTVLPYGWYRARDENDSTFFYTASGETQWLRPTRPANEPLLTEHATRVVIGRSGSSDKTHNTEKSDIHLEGAHKGKGKRISPADGDNDESEETHEQKRKRVSDAQQTVFPDPRGTAIQHTSEPTLPDSRNAASHDKAVDTGLTNQKHPKVLLPRNDTRQASTTHNLAVLETNTRVAHSHMRAESKCRPDSLISKKQSSEIVVKLPPGEPAPSVVHRPSILRRRTTSESPSPDLDRRRKRVRFDRDMEIDIPSIRRVKPCFFWNHHNGPRCRHPGDVCRFNHVCSGCGSRSHARTHCDHTDERSKAFGRTTRAFSRLQPPPSPARESLDSEGRKADVYGRR